MFDKLFKFFLKNNYLYILTKNNLLSRFYVNGLCVFDKAQTKLLINNLLFTKKIALKASKSTNLVIFKATVRGLGYKFIPLSPTKFCLKVGKSHQTVIQIPPSIVYFLKNQTTLFFIGSNRHKLSQFCAYLKKHQTPWRYKEKGIFINHGKVKIIKRDKI